MLLNRNRSLSTQYSILNTYNGNAQLQGAEDLAAVNGLRSEDL